MITLRPETHDDQAFMLGLFVQIRGPEFTLLPLDDTRKSELLGQQFALQHRSYRSQYPDGEFLVVECGHKPVGRLYLSRGGGNCHIIDISLLPETSGRGIGGQLLDRVMAEAATAGRTVSLRVASGNPARRLYLSKGFRETGQEGLHWLMSWSPAGGAE